MDVPRRRIKHTSAPSPTPSPSSSRPSPDDSGRSIFAGEWIKTLDSVLMHRSDMLVRPIVNNPRVEKWTVAHVDSRELPFRPLSIADLESMEDEQVRTFLGEIQAAMVAQAPVSRKMAYLSFLENLLLDAGSASGPSPPIANMLANSSFMFIFVRMLKAFKSIRLKTRVCSVMGLVVRHARIVNPKLQNSGILSTLAEIASEKDANARRRALACLGELMFYIASQTPQDGTGTGGEKDTSTPTSVSASSVHASSSLSSSSATMATSGASQWRGVPSSAIAAVAKALKCTEDETTQHVAVKIIENISAQTSTFLLSKFAVVDVLSGLHKIFTSTKNSLLRQAALSAIVRLSRQNDAFALHVVEKFTLAGIVDMTTSTMSTKNAQNGVNLLCFLVSVRKNEKVRRILFDSLRSNMCESLVRLMEHSSDVLRGKALVCMGVLLSIDERWVSPMAETKIFSAIEKVHARDGSQSDYVRCGMKYLRRAVVSLVERVLVDVATELESKKSSAGRLRGPTFGGRAALGGGGGVLKIWKDYLGPSWIYVFGADSLRARVRSSDAVLSAFSQCLHAVRGLSLKDGNNEDLIVQLLGMLEVWSHDADWVGYKSLMILDSYLPELARMASSGESGPTGLSGRMDSPSLGSGSVRFLAIKIITDLLGQMLRNKGIYELGRDKKGHHTTQKIDEFIVRQLLPLCRGILRDEDPIPIYGLKLLSSVVECNIAFVSVLARLGLVPLFISFLEPGHRNNILHNLKIVQKVVFCTDVDRKLLFENDFIPKFIAVMKHAIENGIDAYIELCFDTAGSLLFQASQLVSQSRVEYESVGSDSTGGNGNGSSGSGSTKASPESMLVNVEPIAKEMCETFASFFMHSDLSIAERASFCVQLCAQLFPVTHDALMGEECLSNCEAALQSPRGSGAMQRRILRTLYYMAASGGRRLARAIRIRDVLWSEVERLANASGTMESALREMAQQVMSVVVEQLR
eukprot:TRINITY_DN1347_c0_g7_i2.p2 TRINITY_DN1347_c0_g7~~TRINITY_DN1347_c0_g7_i2.p2  ORF type:complete len:1138 (-),score=343.50 TRINITY_DN1347_c0_g7_i2:3997-6924(-)